MVRRKKLDDADVTTTKLAVPARKKRKKKAKKKAKATPKKQQPETTTKAPAVITLPKTDMMVSRFKSLLPDIDDLTSRIIAGDLDHTQAIAVTSKADDLVDWAPNVISWCADRRFLGMTPYGKQAEVLLALFEEWCPRCTDINYVSDIPVADNIQIVMSNVALLEFGKCPHCGYTKEMGRAGGTFVDPLELVASIGQRAGKSALASMVTSYLIHRNLMLPLPSKEYGLTPGQVIDFTFVATTKQQSERTLWSTFNGLFQGSSWFKSYKEVCDEEGKKNGIPVTVKALETYLWFEHKRMLIYFAANDPSSLRGSTRFGYAIDELAWFGAASGSKRSNGPETYAALNNACMTLRVNFAKEVERNPACSWPTAMGINISSPREMSDPLMTIYRESARNKRTIRRHWATWEAHPENTLKLLTEIGEAQKPSFARDFGAQPPLADDPLIQRTNIVTEAFRSPMAIEKRYGPLIRPSIKAYTIDMDVPMGAHMTSYLSARLDKNSIGVIPTHVQQLTEDDLAALGPSRDFFTDIISRPLHQRMHIMGVDLAVSNNALAVVCGCMGLGGKFITDFALEVKPTETRNINIADVYENLIVELVDSLNVVAVFYDKWGSLHQIQDLSQRFGSLGPLNDKTARRSWLHGLARRSERPAFIAEHYSLNMADALMLTSRLEQGDCLFPAMEVPFMDLMVNQTLDPSMYPYTHLALQLATVRARGNRLIKPLNRDDDIFRAWTNAAVPAFTNDLVVDLLGQEFRAEPTKKKTANFHVSLGQTGKGIRSVENMGGGAVSTSGTADFPVVVRKGTFRG